MFDIPIAVAVDVEVPRLAPEIETTAYFVVAEALTNVVKHAQATRVSVTASYDDGLLTIDVSTTAWAAPPRTTAPGSPACSIASTPTAAGCRSRANQGTGRRSP